MAEAWFQLRHRGSGDEVRVSTSALAGYPEEEWERFDLPGPPDVDTDEYDYASGQLRENAARKAAKGRKRLKPDDLQDLVEALDRRLKATEEKLGLLPSGIVNPTNQDGTKK